MARLRHVLLALARQDVEPAALVDLAQRLSLRDFGQDNFVTVTYGVLDRDRHVWAESRGGHPPARAVVRSTDGEARFLAYEHRSGLPLGVARDARYETQDHKLPDDDKTPVGHPRIVRTQRRRPTVGLERLRRTFEAIVIEDPDEARARIADSLAGLNAEDDVALLMTMFEGRGDRTTLAQLAFGSRPPSLDR